MKLLGSESQSHARMPLQHNARALQVAGVTFCQLQLAIVKNYYIVYHKNV